MNKIDHFRSLVEEIRDLVEGGISATMGREAASLMSLEDIYENDSFGIMNTVSIDLFNLRLVRAI